jgi:hypothetical protein
MRLATLLLIASFAAVSVDSVGVVHNTASRAASQVGRPLLASGYKHCGVVRVNLGVIDANVWARRVSCSYARRFVKRIARKPDRSKLDGYRCTVSGVDENLYLTCRKGTHAIRTDAIGS